MKINEFSSSIWPWIVWFIIIILATFFVPHLFPHLYSVSQSRDLSALVVIATAALALIAYYQLRKSNRINENEFLLHISGKWGSKEIIKAREVLHDIFLSAYSTEKSNVNNKCKKTQYNNAMCTVAAEVIKMKDVENKTEDFVSLLNLMDFMQTISYFWKRNNFDITSLYNLYGYNIIFLYQAFETFIKNRQPYQKHDYLLFRELYHELIKVKNKEL